jgi:CRP-like cAMP-binding protein
MYTTNNSSVHGSRLQTQQRLTTQHSGIGLYDVHGGSIAEASSARRRDLLLAPLSAVVPKVFKGGRSFPLGRGGTDHRQMSGIPSTANNPAVVATREALRRRFRSTVEAFAFLSSLADDERPGSTGRNWMEPLSSHDIARGFNLLRIRVDVAQLMLQIADKDYRLSPTKSFYSTFTNTFTGCGRTDWSRGGEGSCVSFESWNQQIAWHPPLLQASRALVDARDGMTEIRATALRATAALNTAKASTWRAPSSQKEIEETLNFVRHSRELFEAFVAPSTAFEGSMVSPPIDSLLLSFRDMEALYRQVSILPGWITSQGLGMVYQEVEFEGRVEKEGRNKGNGKLRASGITFDQHQKCVDLIAQRLRLSVGSSLPDYLSAFSKEALQGIAARGHDKKRSLTVESHTVRAFSRIFRAVNDERTYLAFCSESNAARRTQSTRDHARTEDREDYDGELAAPRADASDKKAGMQGGEHTRAYDTRAYDTPGSESQVQVKAPPHSVNYEDDIAQYQMGLPGFVALLRSIGLVAGAAAKQAEQEEESTLKVVPFRRAKEIFEVAARGERSVMLSVARHFHDKAASAALNLDFESYLSAMWLIAAELDESAVPYIFGLAGSPHKAATYPAYTGSTLLGSLLSMHRDSLSLVCGLSMKELFVLLELMQHTRLSAGTRFCSQGALATRAAIVLSGSLKDVKVDGKNSTQDFLYRGSWCAVDVPLLGRNLYTSTVTAESDVELALISTEMWGAFCDRIHVMYSRRQTLADAEQVKERLFMRKALQDGLIQEDKTTARQLEAEDEDRGKNTLVNTHCVPSSGPGSPLAAAASRLKHTGSPDSQSQLQSPDIVKYVRRSPVSHHENDEEVYKEHIEAYKQLRQDNDEMVRPSMSLCRFSVNLCLCRCVSVCV